MRQRTTRKLNLTSLDGQQPQNGFNQRTLACTIRTNERYGFAGLEMQADIIQR
jgi:hypothetical protein